MRILNSTEEEKRKIIDMWTYCFSDSPQFIKWNFSRNFEPSQTFVAERDGEITANLQLIPYKVRLLGEEMPSVYFSGVATMPQYRRQGCARELMCESLMMLKKQGIPICHLIPFKFSFYEKFGFKAAADRLTLNIPLDKIPYTSSAKFELYSDISGITDNVLERLNKIYRGMCGNLKFYIERSAENWTKISEDILINSRGYCAVCEEGYILYGIEGEKISVYELGFSSAEGFRAVLGFLKAHNAQRKTAEIITHFTPIIKAELCDIRDMTSINPLAMLRIIDAEYVLGIIAKKCDGSFVIKVKDEIINENNTCFKIQSGVVMRCEDTEIADITVPISELSPIICGYISLYDACKTGAVDVEDEAVLSRLASVFDRAENSSYMNLML